jgi:hypothetical protein
MLISRTLQPSFMGIVYLLASKHDDLKHEYLGLFRSSFSPHVDEILYDHDHSILQHSIGILAKLGEITPAGATALQNNACRLSMFNVSYLYGCGRKIPISILVFPTAFQLAKEHFDTMLVDYHSYLAKMHYHGIRIDEEFVIDHSNISKMTSKVYRGIQHAYGLNNVYEQGMRKGGNDKKFLMSIHDKLDVTTNELSVAVPSSEFEYEVLKRFLTKK